MPASPAHHTALPGRGGGGSRPLFILPSPGVISPLATARAQRLEAQIPLDEDVWNEDDPPHFPPGGCHCPLQAKPGFLPVIQSIQEQAHRQLGPVWGQQLLQQTHQSSENHKLWILQTPQHLHSRSTCYNKGPVHRPSGKNNQ